MKSVLKETQILCNMDHSNVIKLVDFGKDGVIVKSSGERIENYVYIIMEYATGGLLFDVCSSLPS